MIGNMIGILKRLLFVVGIVLAGAAFLAAGTEIAAYAMNPDLGLMPGAADVWRTVSPETFAAVLAQWPAIVLNGLVLPGWLVLGAPGMALIITCRESSPDASPELEESLFLFDELTKRAREEGYDDAHLDSTALDFQPADPIYARDDVADDLIGEHDFLLDAKSSARENEASAKG
jgi:hypothetical protein